ncbi:Crp/Fnr family transcriptional regulator [Brumimicrobium mesophilum]|uniref:Crp/Fnr family transcriptional regulator n=1 Tax=Brumimicrobium mesophilum TaxID=392717 RepID=UPI000D141BAE|nr:Crp/Fnr family transcriptional regulator [Brumimicrobium mesophilum]
MINYLKSFRLLTEKELQIAEKLAKVKKYKKGDFFIREGSTCKEVAFISKGIFRSFYSTSNGEEVTYCFRFENSFVSAYSSFLTQSKSIENIQAITDIEVLSFTRDDVLKLENSSENWLRFFKINAENEYVEMEKRIFILQKESADQRYRNMMINEPELLKIIPLNYLSSYLGITQRHLSRIRKSIAN